MTSPFLAVDLDALAHGVESFMFGLTGGLIVLIAVPRLIVWVAHQRIAARAAALTQGELVTLAASRMDRDRAVAVLNPRTPAAIVLALALAPANGYRLRAALALAPALSDLDRERILYDEYATAILLAHTTGQDRDRSDAFWSELDHHLAALRRQHLTIEQARAVTRALALQTRWRRLTDASTTTPNDHKGNRS